MTRLEALQSIEAAMQTLGPIYIERCAPTAEIPRWHWMVRANPGRCAASQIGFGDNLVAAYRDLVSKYDMKEAA